MNINDVRKRAKTMGIDSKGVKKADLIRKIQSAEGNIACFDTGRQNCDQMACCWRQDCQKPAAKQGDKA